MLKDLAQYRALIDNQTGAERLLAYITWSNLRDDYYSPDELIDLALRYDCKLDNPLMKIRRGTQITRGVEIKNGSVIEGTEIIIGEGTILDQARIAGSKVHIGKRNHISGNILIGNLKVGDDNFVHGISGRNERGQVSVSNNNNIQDIIITNDGEEEIRIGDNNELRPGLNLSNPFPFGKIKIGNHNRLGDGGGGVISSSYRFARGWGGPVIIGSHVETTRGAEIGGLSLVGWSLTGLQQIAGSEAVVQNLFANGDVSDVIEFLERFWDLNPDTEPAKKSVGLYGVVKLKRGCLVGRTRVRDDVHIRGAYLRNLEIRERCKIYFSVIASDQPIEIGVTDRAIEQQHIHTDQDWHTYPTTIAADIYPPGDYSFFEEARQ